VSRTESSGDYAAVSTRSSPGAELRVVVSDVTPGTPPRPAGLRYGRSHAPGLQNNRNVRNTRDAIPQDTGQEVVIWFSEELVRVILHYHSLPPVTSGTAADRVSTVNAGPEAGAFCSHCRLIRRRQLINFVRVAGVSASALGRGQQTLWHPAT